MRLGRSRAIFLEHEDGRVNTPAEDDAALDRIYFATCAPLPGHKPDGTVVPMSPPTLAELLRHAERFGSEGVYETGAAFLAPSALARLRVDLDQVERNRRGRYGTKIGKARRRSPEETKAMVTQLSVEGLIVSAIADKLGVSDAYVTRILKAA